MVWLVVAAVLGVWAAFAANPDGIWGASRHALTVGFVSTMVFAIGQRVLPAFSGMRLLYSPRLMGASLGVLTAGCLLRVSSEVLAYQGILAKRMESPADFRAHRTNGGHALRGEHDPDLPLPAALRTAGPD